MISLLILVCLGGQVLSLPQKVFYRTEDAENLFNDFMKTYNKQYATESEKMTRFNIFKEKLSFYNEKNQNQDLAVFGIDEFSDSKPEEYIKSCFGDNKPTPCPNTILHSAPTNRSAPTKFDWRDKNVVTRVKNQGACGSCWAFGTTGNIEGQYAIANNELKEFSERQMVDCETTNRVCFPGGAWLSTAMLYVRDAGGIESEQDYPYNVNNVKKCNFDKNKVQAKVASCTEYKFEAEDGIKEILTTVGPLVMGLASDSFDGYKGGILPNCAQTQINHAVLLVGYGEENGTPYWTIKNSWGTGWGEQGYIRVKRNENSCDIMNPNNQIISAILEKNNRRHG